MTNVGNGTTTVGPITNSGSVKLVEVDRGFVGSSASTLPILRMFKFIRII